MRIANEAATKQMGIFQQSLKLIVGLGNPGPEYDNHKHNFGFWVVDCLAKQKGLRFQTSPTRLALEAWGAIEESDCYLIKPMTWMNESGRAVKKVLEEKGVSSENLVVVHDDIDLKLGEMRFVFDAGHGGHNGVRSIIESIGTKAFCRLRIGIGRPPPHVDPADYVLQPFTGESLKAAEQLTVDAVKALKDFLRHGLQWVQNRYH